MASTIWWYGTAARLFNAYIVAAVTEELCKYYFTFDLWNTLIFPYRTWQDVTDNHTPLTGEQALILASHQVSDLNPPSTSFASAQSHGRKSSIKFSRLLIRWKIPRRRKRCPVHTDKGMLLQQEWLVSQLD
jgi:hypothetical protein